VSVLSASYEPTLRRTIAHKGIDRYLDNIVGAPDERAISKLEQARQLASRSSVPTIYVGDTSHDKAVAESCGWEPHLVTCGHQSDERLSQLGVATSDSLLDFLVRLAATDEPEWRTR
jgi:phosphoglycolate phosphatase-like HAD superfamily hydrolase